MRSLTAAILTGTLMALLGCQSNIPASTELGESTAMPTATATPTNNSIPSSVPIPSPTPIAIPTLTPLPINIQSPTFTVAPLPTKIPLRIPTFTPSPTATPRPSTQVKGVLSGTTVLTKEQGPYLLTGPIQVPEGARLIVEQGVHLDFASSFIQIDGTLQINGTAVEPVVLAVSSPERIVLPSLLQFTSHSQAYDERTGDGNYISHATLSDDKHAFQGSIVSVIGTKVAIDNTSMKAWGFGDNLIYVERGSLILRNDVLFNTSSGGAVLHFNNGGGVVLQNHISGYFGIRSTSGTKQLTIMNNEINGLGQGGRGVSLTLPIDGPTTIIKNTIFGFGWGIDVSFYDPNLVGSQPKVSIQSNLITTNGVGLLLSMPNKVTYGVTGNAIYGNKTWNAWVMTTPGLEFSMPGNWWGTTDEQAVDAAILDNNEDFRYGKVNFRPLLTEYPKDVPSKVTRE